MKVIFLGSPDTVVGVLKTLESSKDHDLVAVVSQPARRAGRGKNLLDPPVATYAKERGIPTLQPASAKDPEFLKELSTLKPEVMITAAYGQILSEDFLRIPSRGTINIHPSLLPKYRGATPVPSALIGGDKVTGVTILFTVKALDAGNVILRVESEIAPDEKADALTQRLFDLGADNLAAALEQLEDPSYEGEVQDAEAVTHCRKISKSDGLIDWTLSAKEIENRHRGLFPWPGTYSFFGGKRIAIEDLVEDTTDPAPSLKPGEFSFDAKTKLLLVGGSCGIVAIRRLKPAGSKSQDSAAFWNGAKRSEVPRFENE